MKWSVYVKNGTRYDGLINPGRPSLEDLKATGEFPVDDPRHKYTTTEVSQAIGFDNEVFAGRYVRDRVHPYLQPHCRVVFALNDAEGRLHALEVQDVVSFLEAASHKAAKPEGDPRAAITAGLIDPGTMKLTALGEHAIECLTSLEGCAS